MTIYTVKVAMPGADEPRTFYFKNKEKAQVCRNTYERADDIKHFNADGDDFPLDMLSDGCF